MIFKDLCKELGISLPSKEQFTPIINRHCYSRSELNDLDHEEVTIEKINALINRISNLDIPEDKLVEYVAKDLTLDVDKVKETVRAKVKGIPIGGDWDATRVCYLNEGAIDGLSQDIADNLPSLLKRGE